MNIFQPEKNSPTNKDTPLTPTSTKRDLNNDLENKFIDQNEQESSNNDSQSSHADATTAISNNNPNYIINDYDTQSDEIRESML